MSEAHITLYAEDAKRFEEFREAADETLPGGVTTNSQAVRVALDLAEQRLDAE